MKIRKVLDKKIGDKEYSKYLVTLPKRIVEESELLGEEIEIILKNKKIILQKNNSK